MADMSKKTFMLTSDQRDAIIEIGSLAYDANALLSAMHLGNKDQKTRSQIRRIRDLITGVFANLKEAQIPVPETFSLSDVDFDRKN